jgi:hypothetical protein
MIEFYYDDPIYFEPIALPVEPVPVEIPPSISEPVPVPQPAPQPSPVATTPALTITAPDISEPVQPIEPVYVAPSQPVYVAPVISPMPVNYPVLSPISAPVETPSPDPITPMNLIDYADPIYPANELPPIEYPIYQPTLPPINYTPDGTGFTNTGNVMQQIALIFRAIGLFNYAGSMDLTGSFHATGVPAISYTLTPDDLLTVIINYDPSGNNLLVYASNVGGTMNFIGFTGQLAYLGSQAVTQPAPVLTPVQTLPPVQGTVVDNTPVIQPADVTNLPEPYQTPVDLTPVTIPNFDGGFPVSDVPAPSLGTPNADGTATTNGNVLTPVQTTNSTPTATTGTQTATDTAAGSTAANPDDLIFGYNKYLVYGAAAVAVLILLSAGEK